MKTPNKQIGIYKITSPSGRIYIGQSWNIGNRFMKYKSLSGSRKQRLLHNSIAKYGYNNHVFEIIETLENPTQIELDNREVYYINLYREQGVRLLNIKEGGRGGTHSKESIDKMLASRGKFNHTEETKLKISKSRVGIRHTEETKAILKNYKNGAKIILHLETGIFYLGVKEASVAFNLKYNTLAERLKGRLRNNTNLIYV